MQSYRKKIDPSKVTTIFFPVGKSPLDVLWHPSLPLSDFWCAPTQSRAAYNKT